MRNLFNQDLVNYSDQQLSKIDDDAKTTLISLGKGISALGEMLQVTNLNAISPDAQNNIGSMLYIVGQTVLNTTELQVKAKYQLGKSNY